MIHDERSTYVDKHGCTFHAWLGIAEHKEALKKMYDCYPDRGEAQGFPLSDPAMCEI